jgi:hypothetical protein
MEELAINPMNVKKSRENSPVKEELNKDSNLDYSNVDFNEDPDENLDEDNYDPPPIRWMIKESPEGSKNLLNHEKSNEGSLEDHENNHKIKYENDYDNQDNVPRDSQRDSDGSDSKRDIIDNSRNDVVIRDSKNNSDDSSDKRENKRKILSCDTTSSSDDVIMLIGERDTPFRRPSKREDTIEDAIEEDVVGEREEVDNEVVEGSGSNDSGSDR